VLGDWPGWLALALIAAVAVWSRFLGHQSA
jgi:hypothetical protein